MEFHERFRKVLKDNKLSSQKVSRLSGVGVSTIERYKLGIHTPSVKVLGIISDAIDIPIETFFKSNWIPVEEKQPDLPGYYIVTLVDTKNQVSNTKIDTYRNDPESPTIDYHWISEYCNENAKVIAWMPFPDAYKGV